MPANDVCRKHGFSEASHHLWRGKFGAILRITLIGTHADTARTFFSVRP